MRHLILAVLVILCMVATAIPADLIGSWAGGDANTGSRSGSGAYISFFGETEAPGRLSSSNDLMATLTFWNSASLFTSDSTANDSTGTLKMADWLGKGATIKWTYSSASTSDSGNYSILWQVRYSEYDPWTTAFTFTSGADLAEGTTIDSLDFAAAANCAPEGRIYIDGGGAGNPKDGVLSVWLKLFHTPSIKDY